MNVFIDNAFDIAQTLVHQGHRKWNGLLGYT